VDTLCTIHSEALPGFTTAARTQLLVVDGPDAGRAELIGALGLVAGTGEECGLVLCDERVSRRHLEVIPKGSHFVVRDLASKNGTLYEGSSISEVSVGAGATFKIGHTFVRIVPQATAIELAPSQSRRFGELVGESLVMRELFAVLELAAQSDVTVLLEGATGTGKELAARGLHHEGARRRGAFVAVDCGALPENLLESELFGHVRGAFTGAVEARKGAFVRAHGGTLFLDELDSMSAAAQARLLRVIEERRVRPVGADTDREVDVRLIGGSRRDLSQLVAEGGFRPDLFYRLSVVRLTLPALAARREDLPSLVKELLRRRGFEADGDLPPALLGHGWPGNVRELRNVVERALALSPGAATLGDLRWSLALAPTAQSEPLSLRADLPYADAKERLLDAFEQRYLRDLWARTDGNLSEAARISGVDRKHLRMLLRRQKIIEGD